MKERVISAIIALLITIPLILLGGVYFQILVVILGLIGLYELLKLKKNIPVMMKYISYVLFIMLISSGYVYKDGIYILNFSLILIVLLILMLSMLYYHNNKKYGIEDIFYLFGSIVFLSAAFNLFIVIREKGLMLTIYLFLITTMTDTFAYIIGSKKGKKKLLPDVSPNKSVEGFIGGLVVGTAVASLFYYFCVARANLLLVVFVTMILSIVGQCGDLVFSQIKRYFGIKDYSNLMPGHGGVLDRLDSMIFVLFGYIIISVIL